MAKQTFVCDFGAGLTCTTVVNDTRIYQGKSHIVGMEWSRRPTIDMLVEILPRYREWIHSVNQAVADKTGLKVLYGLQVGPSRKGNAIGGEWEMWLYERGCQPVLSETIGSR